MTYDCMSVNPVNDCISREEILLFLQSEINKTHEGQDCERAVLNRVKEYVLTAK